MKRSAFVFTLLVLSVSTAFAQSSGNFDADVNPTVCTLNASSGNLSPLCSPTANHPHGEPPAYNHPNRRAQQGNPNAKTKSSCSPLRNAPYAS